MNQVFTPLQENFSQFWQARQQREQRFLSAAAAVVLLSLIYLVGIDPALSGRLELRQALPALHQQVAQMHQMAQELATLPATENRQEVSRELVEAAMADNALKALTLSVNDATVRAQFSAIAMSSLQSWLLALQKSSGLFVDEIKITAQDNGLVSATVTLRQSVMNNDNQGR